MSKWQRLWPSAIVTSILLGLSYFFAQTYTPPQNSARLWPDIPPAAATIFSIIGANLAVFVLWHIPPAWRMLNKYFLAVPGYPYAMSMVGNVFSHQSLGHLGMNMFVLWMIGTKRKHNIGYGHMI